MLFTVMKILEHTSPGYAADSGKAEHVRPWKSPTCETPRKPSTRDTRKPCSCYLCVLIHNFLQILQQMVIGATFFLVNIHDPIKVWKVPVQIYSLGIAAAYKPILQLTWLRKTTEKPSLLITAVNTYLWSPSLLSKTIHWDHLLQYLAHCTLKGTRLKIFVRSIVKRSISMNDFLN